MEVELGSMTKKKKRSSTFRGREKWPPPLGNFLGTPLIPLQTKLTEDDKYQNRRLEGLRRFGRVLLQQLQLSARNTSERHVRALSHIAAKTNVAFEHKPIAHTS
jgi:hypothetical protein